MARKRDLAQVDAVCERLGMTLDECLAFRRYLHLLKRSGRGGSLNPRGDFTFAELLDEGKNFLEDRRGGEEQ